MQYTSTTPYLIRAIHEWCVDNNLTPHLLVAVNSQTKVPMAYVKNGEIVLNLSYGATKSLQIENDYISFSARFGGHSQDLYIPINAVKGIFSRENGQGMFFEVMAASEELSPKSGMEVVESSGSEMHEPHIKSTNSKKPSLKIVK